LLFSKDGRPDELRAASFRTAFVALACAMLVVALQPSDGMAQTPKSKTTQKAATKPALRGMSWDSIKAMPDWSGMWTPGRPPADAPRPPAGTGGGGPFAQGAPYKPEFAAKNAERMARVRGDGPGGEANIPLSNSGMCVPGGVPGNMALVSHEYVFQPGRVIILLENSEVRRLWTDGRSHVPVEESNPSFQGDSVGHWEGDTLVVETSNIYPEAEFGFGLHVTGKTVVHERFTRVGDKMRIETEIEDPILFTGPWKYTRWYDREDRAYVEYVPCTLADRAVKDGDKLKGIDFNRDRKLPGE
jgi:hypothetical protein